MSRAASHWVAPYWRAVEHAIGDPVDSATIYVLNPSGTRARRSSGSGICATERCWPRARRW